MGKLSAEELHEVLEELCLTRNPVKKSESTQTLTVKQPKYVCCHISELDILMPSIVPRSERVCHSQIRLKEKETCTTEDQSKIRLKEKETCTTEDQDPVIKSAYQSEYAQTNPVKLESKISQTTYSSSKTLQTDITGKDILYSKSQLPLHKCCKEYELMPTPVSSDRQLAEKGSNTDTFRCCKHRHRSLSRDSFTKAQRLTPSRLNESDSEKEVKKNKKDLIYSKKGNRKKLSSHFCKDDIPLNINQDNSGKDAFIEYNNKYNMDVHQNIMSWAKSPFFQAEKESKNSCNESELSKIHSSTTYPLKDYSKLRHYIINEEEHNNSRIKSEGYLGSVKMKINNPSEHVSYKESLPSFGQEMCLDMSGKTAWTEAFPLGLKGDIISNLDKCFRSSMQIPSTGLRLTRSDSSVTITNSRCTEGVKKSRMPQSSTKTPERNFKAGEPTIYWATTKINVYPDNSRTYEVMPLTGKKPSEVPDKSDSVFVLIPQLKNFPLSK